MWPESLLWKLIVSKTERTSTKAHIGTKKKSEYSRCTSVKQLLTYRILEVTVASQNKIFLGYQMPTLMHSQI